MLNVISSAKKIEVATKSWETSHEVQPAKAEPGVVSDAHLREATPASGDLLSAMAEITTKRVTPLSTGASVARDARKAARRAKLAKEAQNRVYDVRFTSLSWTSATCSQSDYLYREIGAEAISEARLLNVVSRGSNIELSSELNGEIVELRDCLTKKVIATAIPERALVPSSGSNGNGWFEHTLSCLAKGDLGMDIEFNDMRISRIEEVLRDVRLAGLSRVSRQGWDTFENKNVGTIQWKSGIDFRSANSFLLLRINGEMVTYTWGGRTKWVKAARFGIEPADRDLIEQFLGYLK